MKLFTTCPYCRRSFHISREQLDARQGQVRCGRCEQIFDARKSLHDAEADTPPPAPDVPAPSPDAEPLAATQEIVEEIAITALPGDEFIVPAETEETSFAPDVLESSGALPEEEIELPSAVEMPPEIEPTAAFVQILAEPLIHETGASEAAQPEALADELPPAAPKPRRRWPWVVGIGLLLMLLAAQALYFYRTEAAVRYPAAKPLLEQMCQVLQCRIGLPREIDKLGIEGSDLQADPARPALLTLGATLRNRSPFPQTYPLLELSLTDKDDHVIAKRILTPTDYLPPKRPVEAGMPGNGELAITLHFELSDLNAVGYRLYLFYPQS